MLPCTVYDRNKGPGLQMVGFAHHSQTEKAIDIISGIKEAYLSEYQPDIEKQRLMLSMELFSSSQLEITNKSKFISLITSLEALSLQKSYKEYTDHVQDKVEELVNAIKVEVKIPEKYETRLWVKFKEK